MLRDLCPLLIHGVEGDDVLAELAEQQADAGRRVTLLSSDKDLLQMLRRWPEIEVLDPFD